MMRNTCNLTINGRTVQARIGETLVDAGLGASVVIPHDCCSGQCETCRVSVVSGAVDDQGTAEAGTVLACQALVTGPAAIAFEEVPAARKVAGVVKEIVPLGGDVIEVVLALDAPLPHRPGQYASVKFAGFPARDYSPAPRLDGSRKDDELAFHISRLPGGLVSTQLGATIRAGHRVQVRGPFGSAFLRDGDGPLILVAGGTGFAPIWSIALAARREQRHRDMIVICGVRDPSYLYMRPALEWLIEDGATQVIATSETGAIAPLRAGRPTNYLPLLGPEDTVHVAGAQGLVDAVRSKARQAGVRCYADPFLPAAQSLSLIDRVMQMLRAPAAAPAEPAAAHATAGGLGRYLRRQPAVERSAAPREATERRARR